MEHTILSARQLNLYYGENHALKDICIQIPEHQITALIGPSGCGKSTFLRTINRMNDLIPGVKIDGSLFYRGELFQAGWDWIGLYAKYSPIDLFENGKGPKVHPVSIGLQLHL